MISATTPIAPIADVTNIPSKSGMSNEFQEKYRPMECDDFLAATCHVDTDLFAYRRNSRLKRSTDEIKRARMDIEAQIVELKGFLEILKDTKLFTRSVKVMEHLSRKCFGVTKLNVPDIDTFLVDFRAAANATDTVEFTTELVSYEKKLTERKERYAVLYNARESLMSACTKFAPAKIGLQKKIASAALKTDCFEKWMQMSTLRTRVEALRNCRMNLKKTIWDEIISVYIRQFEDSREYVKSVDDAYQIIDTYTSFEPVSNPEGSAFYDRLSAYAKKKESSGTSKDTPSTSSTTPNQSVSTQLPSSSPELDGFRLSISAKRKTPTDGNIPPKRSRLESNPDMGTQVVLPEFFDPTLLQMLQTVSAQTKNSTSSLSTQQSVADQGPRLLFENLFPGDQALVNMLCSSDSNHLTEYVVSVMMTPGVATPFFSSTNLSLLNVLVSTPQLKNYLNYERIIQWVLHPMFEKPQ